MYNRLPLVFHVLILFVSLVSCSPMRAYKGQRPDGSELVTAYFSASNNISISNLSFDEQKVSVFNSGVETTAGVHTYGYSVRYDVRFREERRSSILPRNQICTGKFTAEAGKAYQIRIVRGASYVVEESGFWEVGPRAGGGSCRNDTWW